MISALNNSPTFTSVIPVRVKVDGKESYSEYFIRPACRKLSAILLGPTHKDDTKKLEIISTFAKIDPDYNFNRGVSGHPKIRFNKRPVPSDYFRYVVQKFQHYFLTGPQAETLKKLGKHVGNEKYAGKTLEIDNSLDVEVARDNYWGTLRNYVKNKIHRLTESYDPKTEIKFGKPVSLVINMKSNGKYGQSNFKMDVDSISFEPITT